MSERGELHAQIVTALRQLTAEPPGVHAIIISAGDAYTQFGLPSGGDRNWLPFEAVSDEFLPDGAHLSVTQKSRLAALGFAAPSIERETPDRGVFHGVTCNWHQLVELDLANHEELAAKALDVMTSVYGVRTDAIDVALVGGPFGERAYPAIDRSDFAPNFTKTVENEVLDVGWAEVELADGRPARVECWAQDQMTCVTIFLSALGLEGIPDEGFPDFLEEVGLAYYLGSEYRSAGVARFRDPAGNDMLGLNLVVADEGGVLVEVPAGLLPYPRPAGPGSESR